MMEMDLAVEQQQTMRISPRLVAANHILELSSMELQEALQQEMQENPALEMTEYVNCPRCGAVMVDKICHNCARADSAQTPEPATFDASETYMETGIWHSGSTRDRDEQVDLLSLVAAPLTLSERLLFDLRPLLSGDAQEAVAEYLIGNLDDNGFLHCSISEVVEALGVTREEAEEVLRRLQTLEPIGIGARDPHECLLIQLRYLESQGQGHRVALRIVSDFLDELGTHKYGRIAQALGISQEEVIAAAHFVRDELTPYPAQQEVSRSRSAPAEIPRYVLPDVVIRRRDGELEVEVVESYRFILRVSPLYQEMWRTVARKPGDFSEQDREHIRRYISRANVFMANLKQRRQTMEKIGNFLAEYQHDFLLEGVRSLKPLTRAMVAQYTGMHESTVSRATAGKWVMIPSGKVIPFSDFFTPALNVKDVIKEMIEGESEPLTDQQIAEHLAEHGYHIARRTVAKYRDQLGILPSSLRD